MKLAAAVVPYSSVVGSSIRLCDDKTGKVVALLIISIPSPEFEYKATAKIVVDDIMWRLSKRPVAFRVRDADGKWVLWDDEDACSRYATSVGQEYEGLYVRDGS